MARLFAVALCGLLTLCLAAPASAAREARSISFPSISADGSTLYFTCFGDIWSAPRDGAAPARRLTDNVAYDGRPMPSPDGKQLLFTSDRLGNYDLYLMSAEGGTATKISWGASWDYPYDWAPDGKSVLEYAVQQDLWGNSIYELSLDGTQPRRITGPDQQDNVQGSYLDGARSVVFARGAGDWTRKNYVGSATYDLYSYDRQTKLYKQLTSEPGNELWPQPSSDGKTVYFVSDRDDTYNLWALDVASGKQAQLTRFKGDGPRWPRISSDGDELVFEVFGQLYAMRLPEGQAEKVALSFDGDYKHEMAYAQDLPNNAGEYMLSPNGNYFTVTVLGDLYVLKNPDIYKEDEKPDQDLSRAFAATCSPGRETQPAWSPDSTRLAYISDRDGQFDVYVLDLATKDEKRITDTPADEWYPTFSPAAKRDAAKQHLLYYSGNSKLMLFDLMDGSERVLREGTLRTGPWALGYDWAPDGKWLAFEEITQDDSADVFFVGLPDDGTIGQPVNVSVSPDWEDGATWSKDGKWLAFNHYTDTGSDVLLLELNPKKQTYDTDILFPDDKPKSPEEKPKEEAKPGSTDIMSVSLEEEDGQDVRPTEDLPTGDAKTEVGKEGEKKDEEKKDEEPKLPEVLIDFTRLHLRAKPLTDMNGSATFAGFDPLSKFLIFSTDHEGKPELWSVTLDDKHELALLGPAEGRTSPQFALDGKRLYFLEGGGIGYLEMNGPQAAGGGGVPLTSHVGIDQYAMWEQMLKEGWRHLRDGFYDPNMHGVDWNDVLSRYLPRVRECGCQEDFGGLMREMVGELGGSHLGFYNVHNSREVSPENSADFGVYYDETYSGSGWLISKVLMNSPADQPASKLYAGDLILKVNGKAVSSTDYRANVLLDLGGQPVVLTVKRDANVAAAPDTPEALAKELPKAGERSVTIKPALDGALGQLRYEQWVEDNRQAVDKLTGGQIGYHHIQGMELDSYEKFRRELFSESLEKKALIIDVRFNGGGWTHEMVLDLLNRQPFAVTQFRGGARRTQPVLHWTGPIVVLTNPNSYSDAEIFPHIMKELGLATLIGEPTGGNVIGTYDFPLLDGSDFRLPAEGWWLLDQTNMEGHGAQPDVLVPFDEAAYGQGHDNQLEAAVKYLEEKIGQ